MKAYCIFDVREIYDADRLQRYSLGVLKTVQAYGGRYLSLGGDCRVLEGDWSPVFPVLIEFPGSAEANAWYDSSEYRELKRLRMQAARCDGVLIEPVDSELRRHLVADN